MLLVVVLTCIALRIVKSVKSAIAEGIHPKMITKGSSGSYFARAKTEGGRVQTVACVVFRVLYARILIYFQCLQAKGRGALWTFEPEGTTSTSKPYTICDNATRPRNGYIASFDGSSLSGEHVLYLTSGALLTRKSLIFDLHRAKLYI